MNKLTLPLILTLCASALAAANPQAPTYANLVPPLSDEDDKRTEHRLEADRLPIVVEPFTEHVKEALPDPPGGKAVRIEVDAQGALVAVAEDGSAFRWTPEGAWTPAEAGAATGDAAVRLGDDTWRATEDGLYRNDERLASYGVNGPLATRITALAADSRGVLWAGTPLGLSKRAADGAWTHVRGRDGLPYEDITSLAFDAQDNLWIGTARGAVLYKPYAEGRQWFYRASKRYLPDDRILDVAVAPDGSVAWFATPAGLGAIRTVTTTLLERANAIEKRVNERHRRLGLVAECELDPNDPAAYTISDFDNDGLWTAYHVAAMALCYGATQDPAAKESARTGMHALYMLQDASGTPGLVARSVLPLEVGKTKGAQWRLTPDGSMYWKSDTSSDEIDGHYLAFYTYWEHIAKNDPEERDRCIQQVRELTDYIVDNNYQLIDWDGERTSWGFWNPENLNDNPVHYLENGLNSLQILSFLKVAHYVTGDAKYAEHYDHLIREHGYLNNILLTKKVFPDINNHSDDQLGYVAWYPILQLEKDPALRETLQRGVRRHYKIVQPEKPSFYAFATGTIDPHYVDFEAAVENLREIPTDRRGYRMDNSHRADVVFDPRVDRFGDLQFIQALPADERAFAKWNRNPYLADDGNGEFNEDDGAAYLLPYWMGRFHGFIAEK